MIDFNVPYLSQNEMKDIRKVIGNRKFQGNGPFSKKTEKYLSGLTGSSKILLTSSGTQALDMSALLIDIKRNDEVVMPSYTFSSTANAFILRGAKIKFIDVHPGTMNMNENLIEDAITDKTKAIVPVHYAGVSCDMDKVNSIARAYQLKVIEDAAQGISAYYKERSLGSIGDAGIYSFHETKNIHCGEGGAILINNKDYYDKSDVIMEKGTNRAKFIRREINHYNWVALGSSFLVNEITAAFLYSQLGDVNKVTKKRLNLWNYYYDNLKEIEGIDLPYVPPYSKHNAHIFYIKTKNKEIREKLRLFLWRNGIDSRTHFIPLHSSPYGLKNTKFIGKDEYTTQEANRLLRLPMHYYLTNADIDYIIKIIADFYKNHL